MRVESAPMLGFAAVLLAGSLVTDRRTRKILLALSLAGLLALMLRLSLHLSVPMGDYANFVESKHNFKRYFGDTLSFQFYLGGAIVHELNASFGADSGSRVAAFDALARIAAGLFVVALFLFAAQMKWTAQTLRYVALAIAIPTTLLFFGYHEFGHLPAALDVVAVPLALVGLETNRRSYLYGAGFLAGVGCAFHGFGLIALAFIVLFTTVYLWREQTTRSALGRAMPLSVCVAGLVGWLVWLPIFLIGPGWGIEPGHSAVRPLRPFVHAHYVADAHRIAEPILSTSVIGEIGWELAVTGAALFLLVVWFERGTSRTALVVATVPIFLFLVWFWPVQGLGNDSDFLGSAFPPTYAAAWMLARRFRPAALALLILAAGNVAIAHVLTWPFVHGPVPRP